jgi:hypothetical protein
VSHASKQAVVQRRLVPLATALAVAGALAVPLAGVAHAQVLTKLNAEKEDADKPVGDQHKVTANLEDEAGNPYSPPTSANVDFEVDGPNDPNNDGYSPGTPDETCTINSGATKCSRQYPVNVIGEDTVWVWVDLGADNNPTGEVDQGEGRDAKADPGDIPEPDLTDVVLRSGFSPVADTLNCDEKRTAEDGNDVTVDCFTDARQAGILIDGENLGGANDPDSPPGTDTADYNDDCVTDANGACTVTIAQSEGQIGTANVCFWIDEEDDSSYHPGLEAQRDGSLCAAPSGVEGVGAPENNNITDVVTIGWGTSRKVSLTVPTAAKKWNSKFTIRGSVTSSSQSCEQGVTVAVQRDELGGSVNYVGWRQDTTGSGGGYSLTATASSSANYRAVIADDNPCLGDLSGTKKLLVAKKVTRSVSDANVKRGKSVNITGLVKPCKGHRYDKASLWRKKGGRWRKVATDKTNGDCKAFFQRKIRKTSTYQVRSGKQDADHQAGKSAVVKIRVH